jgi:hypothetical protein
VLAELELASYLAVGILIGMLLMIAILVEYEE